MVGKIKYFAKLRFVRSVHICGRCLCCTKTA